MNGLKKLAPAIVLVLFAQAVSAETRPAAPQATVLERLLNGPRLINIVDDFLIFWEFAKGQPLHRQRMLWDRMVEAKHRDFFERAVYRHADPGERRTMLDEFLLRVPAQIDAIRELNKNIQNSIIEAYVHFKETRFRDYRHQHHIYFGVSLFRFDGAVRPVSNDAGIPDTLCLGAEVLAGYTPDQVRMVVIHEFFHLYHFNYLFRQPQPSEFRAAHMPLMIEGLAVAGAEEAYPYQPRSVYLHFTDDEIAAEQHDLAANASRYLALIRGGVMPEEYEPWFKVNQDGDIPSRGGYLLGYEVVKRMLAAYTLEQIVRMTPAELREQAEEQLAAISGDRVFLFAGPR